MKPSYLSHVEELEERVLSICSRLSPVNFADVEVNLLSVNRNVLAVRLHVNLSVTNKLRFSSTVVRSGIHPSYSTILSSYLLDVSRQFDKSLGVRVHCPCSEPEEADVPNSEESHQDR